MHYSFPASGDAGWDPAPWGDRLGSSCTSWPFGEDSPAPQQQPKGEEGAGMSLGHRVVPRHRAAQGLAGKGTAKLAFPQPFSDDCGPK